MANTGVSRRGFLISAAAGAAVWLTPRRLFAEVPGIVERIRHAAATDEMTVQKLRDNISVIFGSGGNVAVLYGPDGVLLVDAGIVGPRVAKSVASITSQPVARILNTHWHFDHTDANAYFGSHGARISATENTRVHMSRATRVDDWDFTFPRAPDPAIPVETFTSERGLKLNGTGILMRPYVPGHGPVGDRAKLTAFRDMLVAVRDRVAELKKQGKSIDATIAARPTADYDASWTGLIDPAFFVRLVYKGV